MTSVGTSTKKEFTVHYNTTRINDLDIFYRDAGPQDAPVILLLHGFPTSSNMFRNLIPRLANSFRVIAPDYPGFGLSSMPDHKSYAYTFENFADIVDKLAEQLASRSSRSAAARSSPRWDMRFRRRRSNAARSTPSSLRAASQRRQLRRGC
jgi:alpha-beta hydrolase superfamily lysophospholipase